MALKLKFACYFINWRQSAEIRSKTLISLRFTVVPGSDTWIPTTMQVSGSNMHDASRAARTERLRETVRRAGGNKIVAERTGLKLRTLDGYLAGGEIKTSALVAIAEACGVSVEWLAVGKVTDIQKSAGNAEKLVPLHPPAIDATALAKAMEIVEALSGRDQPVRERAARIAAAYDLLTKPTEDLPPLPQLPGKQP